MAFSNKSDGVDIIHAADIDALQDAVTAVTPQTAGGVMAGTANGPSETVPPTAADAYEFRVVKSKQAIWVKRRFISLEDYAPSQSNDWTDALTSALTDAKAAGGGAEYGTGNQRMVDIPPGTFPYSGKISITDWVGLRGAGKDVTILTATASGATLDFATSAGRHGGFTVDGNNVAQDGMTFHAGSQLMVEDINVYDHVRHGIVTHNLQNSSFVNVNPRHNGDTGFVVDDGTGSCVFLRCEAEDNGQRAIALTQSGTEPSGYSQPTFNRFIGGLCEHVRTGSECLLYVGASAGNTFEGYIFTPGSFAAAQFAFPLVKLRKDTLASTADIWLSACNILGNPTYHTAFDIGANCQVTFLDGYNGVTGALIMFQVDSNGKVRGFPGLPNSVATYFAGTNGAIENANILIDVRAQLYLERRATSDAAITGTISTDVGARWRDNADGKRNWGDGTTYSFDTNLYRARANVLQTDDRFQAVDGVTTKVKAGTPTDADFQASPPDGTLVVDTSASKLWVRVGGAWKSVAAT